VGGAVHRVNPRQAGKREIEPSTRGVNR
jgi:hypothetical protein